MAILNTGKLADTLNVERVELDVDALKDQLSKVEVGDDSDEILRNNIKRANALLDKIQEEILNGDVQARLFEVAGQLINAVTTAANSIASSSIDIEGLELKRKMMELKESELEVKKNSLPTQGGSYTQNNNIIVASREEVLKMLQKEVEDSTPIDLSDE